MLFQTVVTVFMFFPGFICRERMFRIQSCFQFFCRGERQGHFLGISQEYIVGHADCKSVCFSNLSADIVLAPFEGRPGTANLVLLPDFSQSVGGGVKSCNILDGYVRVVIRGVSDFGSIKEMARQIRLLFRQNEDYPPGVQVFQIFEE